MERSIDPQLSVLPGTRLPPATHSQPPFEIPPRQSSLRSTLDAQSLKRKFLDSDEKLAKLDAMSYTDLVDLRDQINTKIKQRKTRMQTEYSQSEGERGTYKFWQDKFELESDYTRAAMLHKKISIDSFKTTRKGSEEGWGETEEAQEANIREEKHLLDLKVAEYQRDTLGAMIGDPSRAARRAFIESFCSLMGLRKGGRDKSKQQEFRKALGKSYMQVNERDQFIWCPITTTWHPKFHMTAAHIFPWKLGQANMDALFGRQKDLNPVEEERDPEGIAELFAPQNGLLIYSEVEKLLDKGHIVIVSAIEEPLTKEEVEKWDAAQTKEFKVKIIAPEAKDMALRIHMNTQETFMDLDEKRLVFIEGCTMRPRARYLYWHFCFAIMKRSFHHGAIEKPLLDEVGRPYWGTVGPYAKERMIRAFTEHLGHDYTGLLGGSEESQDENADPLLDPLMLMTASTNIGRVAELEDDGEDTREYFDDHDDSEDGSEDDNNDWDEDGDEI